MHTEHYISYIYIYIHTILYTAFIPSSRNWWMINHTSLTSLFVDVPDASLWIFGKTSCCTSCLFDKTTRRVCSTRNQQIVLHDMKCRKGIDFLDFENRYTVTVRVYIYIYGLTWDWRHPSHFSLHFEVHLPLSWTSIPELEPEEAKRRCFVVLGWTCFDRLAWFGAMVSQLSLWDSS